MSKIYEALLRAEMDRIAQSNQSPNGSVAAMPEAVSEPAAAAPHTSESPEALLLQNGLLSQVGGRPTAWDPDMSRLPALESRGALVEQLRVLRSRLYEMRLDRPIKSLLVSSGLPEEGKSFVAANLAISLAKSRNTRVLLIDGDMRRGTLHKLLGTDREPGLTEFLAGTATLDQVTQHMLPEAGKTVSGLSTLTFLPSGHDTENASDLSGNGRFELLLRCLADQFEWIIVDSSPVTLVSDSVNLGRHCDGVLLVARGGVTRYEVAQRAMQELKASQVLGVVLNAVEGTNQVGGYYGYDS